MGLADDLENARDGNIWKSLCGVQKAMEQHPEDADTIFNFCTLRHDKPAASLSKTFEQYDIRISDQMISRHRKNRCACAERMPERYDT